MMEISKSTMEELQRFEDDELEKLKLNIRAIKVVTMSDLTDYIMVCKEDCWTKDGWNKLSDELESVLTYAD